MPNKLLFKKPFCRLLLLLLLVFALLLPPGTPFGNRGAFKFGPDKFWSFLRLAVSDLLWLRSTGALAITGSSGTGPRPGSPSVDSRPGANSGKPDLPS